jgi:hypothetical protein
MKRSAATLGRASGVRVGETLALTLVLMVGGVFPAGRAHAQRGEPAHRGDGHTVGVTPTRFPAGPPRGPAPAHLREPIRPQPESHAPPVPASGALGQRGEPHAHAEVGQRGGGERPHVDPDARWVGHDSGRRDPRYHVEHPFPHGRFKQPMGRGHVYRIGGWDAPHRRLWFAGSYFVLAEPDSAYVGDWDWASDDVVLYDDPDHPGFYLAYNVRLGTYVHVQYDGSR